MMIVWTGRGFLSALVLLIVLFISILILPDGSTDYGFVTAFFVAGLFSWIFGVKWNKQNERLVIDATTGQKLLLKNSHSLFWIPMQYWGIIFSIFGIIILAQNSIWLSILFAMILLTITGVVYFRTRSLTNVAIDRRIVATPKVDNTILKTETVESEADRLKRRQEKEDHSRFMPK